MNTLSKTEPITRNDNDGISRIAVSFTMVIVMLYLMDVMLRSILTRDSRVLAAQSTVPQSSADLPYFGEVEPRVLTITDVTGWVDLVHNPPYVPWISANFFNDGPDTAFLSMNYPSNFTELRIGESLQINLTGAIRRLEVIFFRCNSGQTASVRVVGKY